MNEYFVIKIGDSEEEILNERIHITREMQINAPLFNTEEDANTYINLIDPDAVWVIGLLNRREDEQDL